MQILCLLVIEYYIRLSTHKQIRTKTDGGFTDKKNLEYEFPENVNSVVPVWSIGKIFSCKVHV